MAEQTEQTLNRGGRIFALFMAVTVLAAIVPTRERDLYPFAPGSDTALLGNMVQGEEEFADGPVYQIVRAVNRAKGVVASLDRPAASAAPDIAADIPTDAAPFAQALAPAQTPAAVAQSAPPLLADAGSVTNRGIVNGPLIGRVGGLPGAAGIVSSSGSSTSSSSGGTSTSTSGGTGTTTSTGGTTGSSGGPDPIGAVPEPGTWALLLTGFMLVGAAMRRRPAGRKAATTAS